MTDKQFLSAERTQELIDTSKEKFIQGNSDSVTTLSSADNIGIAVTTVNANGVSTIIGFLPIN